MICRGPSTRLRSILSTGNSAKTTTIIWTAPIPTVVSHNSRMTRLVVHLSESQVAQANVALSAEDCGSLDGVNTIKQDYEWAAESAQVKSSAALLDQVAAGEQQSSASTTSPATTRTVPTTTTTAPPTQGMIQFQADVQSLGVDIKNVMADASAPAANAATPNFTQLRLDCQTMSNDALTMNSDAQGVVTSAEESEESLLSQDALTSADDCTSGALEITQFNRIRSTMRRRPRSQT